MADGGSSQLIAGFILTTLTLIGVLLALCILPARIRRIKLGSLHPSVGGSDAPTPSTRALLFALALVSLGGVKLAALSLDRWGRATQRT